MASGYKFFGAKIGGNAGYSVASAGDVDGDGKADLIIGAPFADGGSNQSGESYLLLAADLAAADARDGTVDGIIDLENSCFAEGTLTATASGEVAVENLAPGDLVLTAEGRLVPIRFNLRQTLPLNSARVPERLQPVCIRASALGVGVPHSDLVVTADHGMVLDGLLINASALVNGANIDFVTLSELPERMTYYPIETDTHEVILANGAPAETFVDTVGRRTFDNYLEYPDLYGAERIIPEMDRPRVSSLRLLPDDIKAQLGIKENVVDFNAVLNA